MAARAIITEEEAELLTATNMAKLVRYIGDLQMVQGTFMCLVVDDPVTRRTHFVGNDRDGSGDPQSLMRELRRLVQEVKGKEPSEAMVYPPKNRKVDA